MEWLLFLLFGAGAVAYSSKFLKYKKEESKTMTTNTFDEETGVKEEYVDNGLEKSIDVATYYIYLKKHCYCDLSQDERVQDLGEWTAYKHESFKLLTPYVRAGVYDELKKRLELTDDDIKMVGIRDLYAPIRF